MSLRLIGLLLLKLIAPIDTTTDCLVNQNNQEVCLNDVISEKTVIIAFWASWCKPCLLELDEINELLEEAPEHHTIEFHAVSIDEARTSSKVPFIASYRDWDFSILIDEDQTWKRYFAVENLPTLLITSDNEIIKRREGYSPDLTSELANYLDFE